MYLAEMATNRNNAIKYIKDIMPDIKEHIIKCIIYDYMKDTVRHWIDTEITPDVYDIATIKIKTANGKLTKEDYLEIFDDFFDEDEFDAERHLNQFYRLNRRDQKYPVEKPTSDHAERLFNVYNVFRNVFAPMFEQKNDKISKEQINDILWESLV